MRCVIISTLYESGGAEVQAYSQFRYLNDNNHDCYYLTFDPNLHTGEKKEEKHLNIIGDYTVAKRRRKDFFIDIFLLHQMKKTFSEIKPDMIHLHNVSYAFTTICHAAKEYLTVQTMHDYRAICNKGEKTKDDCSICKETSWKNCRRDCYNENWRSRIKITYRNILNTHIMKCRKKHIKFIVAPSKKLTDWLRCFGYDAQVLNNPVNTDEFEHFHKKILEPERKKEILYYGAVRRNKGVIKLLEHYSSEEYRTLELHIIGKLDKNIDMEEFKALLKKSGAIYEGVMSHDQIIKRLETVFSVIIPSIWMENYPNVGLEGIYSDCVVCGSDRGGMTEQIVEDELIFDIMKRDDVIRCLKIIDAMSVNEYLEICRKQKERFYQNNTPQMYLMRLFNIIGLTK